MIVTAPALQDRDRIAALLQKHDKPGPRYTSYPTAVEFHEGVDAQVAEKHLAAADAAEGPLSVYVHLPFCEKRCHFCGCHVIISPDKAPASPYLDLLKREIELIAKRLPNRRQIAQLHLGGGTPTYFSPAQLTDLLQHLFAHFEVVDGAELAVEVDPRVTSAAHVDTLADLGFNRMSLGVQDFTRDVQEAIGRVQTIEQTARIMEQARERGYRGLNVDLIYGLPHQSARSFEATVDQVIALGADRCAVYSFAYVPDGRGHQNRIDLTALPDPQDKLGLFAIARERFLAAGYVPIGMDHFAKPDDELGRARIAGTLRRNFQGYTVIPADDVLGLGISAIGDMRGAYLQNHKKLSRYTEAVEAGELPIYRGVARSPDDELRRDAIHRLMCNFRVDLDAVAEAHGHADHHVFDDALEHLRPMQDEGLVEVEGGLVTATPEGELFVRNLAMCFDTYYWAKYAEAKKSVFSRTV